MKFLNKNIKLAIFDMDGTLIDSTSIWGEIDKAFFAKRGINEVPKKYGQEIVHRGLVKGAEWTIKEYGFTNDTVEGVIKEWQDASKEEYLHHIPLKKSAKEILQFFKDGGAKLVLATANDRELYEPCLKRLGIMKYFDFVTDVNQINEEKSSINFYDSIIKRFGVSRDETVVFEDTLISLRTLKPAGYLTIGVDDKASECVVKEKKENCDKYILCFDELLNK